MCQNYLKDHQEILVNGTDKLMWDVSQYAANPWIKHNNEMLLLLLLLSSSFHNQTQ